MKKYIVLLLTASLIFGMSASALAEDTGQSTKFIEVLASKLESLLDADNVLGSPVEFEGTKIIPIVSRGFGFGGGSGAGGAETEQGEGTAVGAGGGVMPVSLLVITKDGEVKIVSVKKGEFGEIMKALAPMIIDTVKSGLGQQSKGAPAPTEEPAQN